MRKAILSTFVALLPMLGLAFPYATNPATRLRVADISSSYTNFTWQIDGGSDFLITNVWWDAAVTGVYLRFAWQDEVYLDVTNGTVVNGTSFWALVTHTNFPGNGPYKLEFLGWENNYTSVPRRVLGKGQANIQNSIWQSTNNASWVNPQAGMVIGPPIHTITDPSNWPFATSAQITNVSNGGEASTGEVTIVDGDVVITFPRDDDGQDRVLISDGTATNITLVGDVKADNEAVYAAAFSASTNGQQSDVVYLSLTDYAFNGGLGGGIFRALYNRWAGIVDYDFSLAFGIHSNSERRITLPGDNVIATFGVNNGGPSLSNTIAFDAPLSMGGHRITNLAAAVDQLDAIPYYQAQNLGAQQALAMTDELLSGTNTWTGSNTFNNGILSPLVRATTSGGMQIQSLNGSTCAVFGAGSDCNVSFGDGATFAGTITAPTHSLGVGTFTGSVYSTVDHTSMAPASNELVTADWVRGLSMSGQEWFFTTNVVTEPPAVIAKTTNVVSLSADVPATVFSNSIVSPTNLQYLAAGITTNLYTGLRSPVTFEVYANISGGNPASVIHMHPELYYYYVGGGETNLLGDWEAANQSVTATMLTPTRFLFTVAFPEPTITGSVALVGFLKCGGVGGAAATLNLVGGGIYPSHMDIERASSGSGSGFPLTADADFLLQLDSVRFDLHNIAFRSLISDAQYSVPLYDGYLSVFTTSADDWDEAASTNVYHVGRGQRYVGAMTPGYAGVFSNSAVQYSFSSAVSQTNGVTFMCWYFMRAAVASAGLVCDPDRSPILVFDLSGTKPRFISALGGGVVGSTALGLNAWNHIAGTATTGGLYSVYINGILDEATAGTFSTTAVANVVMGYELAGTTRRVNGYVDDVRVYSRVLTQPEIAAIYNSGVGQPFPPVDADLAAAFEFEGDNREYLSGRAATNAYGANIPDPAFTNSIIAFVGTNFGTMVSDPYTLTSDPTRLYGALWIDSATTNFSMNTNVFYDVSANNGTNWSTFNMEPQFIGALGYPVFYRGLLTNGFTAGRSLISRVRVTNSAAISVKGASRQTD